MFFDNRRDAGKRVAQLVQAQYDVHLPFEVVGIARGGVVIADEVASVFNLTPKAICIGTLEIRKDLRLIGTSLGSGMIFRSRLDGEVGEFVPDLRVLSFDGIPDFVDSIVAKQERFAGKETVYGDRVLLCDDGIVSGQSLITVTYALRHAGVQEVVAVLPVVLRWFADQKYIPFITWRVSKMTRPATGMFYRSFEDTPDEEVIRALTTTFEASIQ